jgi:hypothetical protein
MIKPCFTEDDVADFGLKLVVEWLREGGVINRGLVLGIRSVEPQEGRIQAFEIDR